MTLIALSEIQASYSLTDINPECFPPTKDLPCFVFLLLPPSFSDTDLLRAFFFSPALSSFPIIAAAGSFGFLLLSYLDLIQSFSNITLLFFSFKSFSFIFFFTIKQNLAMNVFLVFCCSWSNLIIFTVPILEKFSGLVLEYSQLA